MKKIFILFPILSLAFFAKAQESVLTAGGESGDIIWSVGEVMTTMLSDDAGTIYLTQGLIQPVQKASVGISYTKSEILPKVFPNPVVDNLYINWSETSYTWRVYNTTGKLQNSGQVASGQDAVIDFSNYEKGYYMVVIMSEGNIHSIKVIK